jgi:hypothetical protein
MKIIITEDQKYSLEKYIYDYFDENLVPAEGWLGKKYYKKEVDTFDELFFFFDEDAEGLGDEPHMFYSICDNANFDKPLPEGKCPMVTINSTKYDILTGYFGPRWEELFKIWFTEHTGLPVNYVERQDW